MTKIEFYSFIAPSRQKQYQPLNLVSVPRPRKRVREVEDPHKTDEFIKVRQEARTLLERERNKRKANIDILQQEILRLEASKNNATNPETKERIQDIIDNYKEVIQNAQLMIEQPTSSAPTDDPFALQYQGRPVIEPPQYPALEEAPYIASEEAPKELSISQQAIYDYIIYKFENADKLNAALGLEQLKNLFLLSVDQRKEYINKIIRGDERGIVVFKDLAFAFKEATDRPENFTDNELDLMDLFEKSLTDTLAEEGMSDALEIYNQVGMIEELEELETDEAIVESLPEEIRNRIKINIRRRTTEEKADRAEAEKEAERKKERKKEQNKYNKAKKQRDALIEDMVRKETNKIKSPPYKGIAAKQNLTEYLLSDPPPPIYIKLGKDTLNSFIEDSKEIRIKKKDGTLTEQPANDFRKEIIKLYREALELEYPTPKPPQTEEEPRKDEGGPSQPPQTGPPQTQQTPSTDDFTQGVLQGLYDEEREKIPDVLQPGPSKTKPPPKQPESQAGPSKTKPTEQPKPKPQAGPSEEQVRGYLKKIGEIKKVDQTRLSEITQTVRELYDSKKAGFGLPEGVQILGPPPKEGEPTEEETQRKLYGVALDIGDYTFDEKNEFNKEFAEFIIKYVFDYIIDSFDNMLQIYEKLYNNTMNETYLQGERRMNQFLPTLKSTSNAIKEKFGIVKMSNPNELQLVLNELSKKGLFGDSAGEQSLNQSIAYYIRQLYSAKESGTPIDGIDTYTTQQDIMETASFLSQRIRSKPPKLSEDFANFVIENFFKYLRDVVFEDLKSNYTLSKEPTAAKRIEDNQKALTTEIKSIEEEFAERKKKKSGSGFKKDQIDKLILSIIDILEGQQKINMNIFSQDELLLFKSILDSGMTQKEQDKVEGILKGLKGKIGGLFDKQYPHKQTKPYYLKR